MAGHRCQQVGSKSLQTPAQPTSLAAPARFIRLYWPLAVTGTGATGRALQQHGATHLVLDVFGVLLSQVGSSGIAPASRMLLPVDPVGPSWVQRRVAVGVDAELFVPAGLDDAEFFDGDGVVS
jgi:hypothetical protein